MLTLAELKDVVVTLVSIVGGTVAVVGLSTWRQQLKGTTNYQVALKVIRTALSLKDAISDARQPIIWGGEMADRRAEEGESFKEAAVKGEAHAYYKRLSHIREAHREFYAAGLEARAIWGDKIHAILQPLTQATNKLFTDTGLYFELRLAEARTGEGDELIRELRRTLFARSEDVYHQSIVEATQAIERQFREFLR